jgi:hypothetical protein
VIITGTGIGNAEAKAATALGLAAPGAVGGPSLAGKPDAVTLARAAAEALMALPS